MSSLGARYHYSNTLSDDDIITHPITDVMNDIYGTHEEAFVFSTLHLILFSLTLPAPTLAHLLIGFPILATQPKELSRVVLQTPV
jgi:hypothetical protein